MSKKDTVGPHKDNANLIRRLLFFILLFTLVFFYLVLSFKGLTHARGIEQAQIGREIARGNDFTTKVIRPAAIWQANRTDAAAPELDRFYDTYHSPLNPFLNAAVLKIVGGDDFNKFKMVGESRQIYQLDRVIAAISVICFLIAIGVNYLLISRIFDVKIAGVTALLMALCDLMWKFTQTGLPQMLMLLLFSCALFFCYRALEASVENRMGIGAVLVASVFFALLSLAHWLTIWITIGFILYAAFFFRPKGVAGLAVLGILLVFNLYFMGKNMEWTGSPAGTAGLTLYGGLADSEENIMRTVDPSGETTTVLYNMNSLLLNTTKNILLQANALYTNLGGIIAAPLFFFALLHPFKRASIAHFRWIVLLMWIFGALGMAIFGVTKNSTDANQIHILFVPIMTAYGLAFLSILWSRLELPARSGVLRNGHFILAVMISAGPLILSIPKSFQSSLYISGRGGSPVWPPYWPSAYSRILHDVTEEDDIIFSDQPWAIAWYGDRRSIWLPKSVTDFESLEQMAQDQNLEVAGIVVSPSSFALNPLYQIGSYGNADEFASMHLDSPAALSSGGGLGSLPSRDPKLTGVMSRYKYPRNLFIGRIVFYAAKPVLNQ
ncbi:MAG: hypothetical protein ACON5H_11830 [Akkermansiaceae bacterium]